MENILKTISQFISITDEIKSILIENLKRREIPKGDLLLEQGKTCRELYFIDKGLFRGFYFQKGKEITTWFAIESEIFTSMYSFIAQKPGFEAIEALEDSVVYSINYQALHLLYESNPEFNLMGRLMIEKYYIELEDRTLSLQFNSAKERYNNILTHHSHLLQRVSLGQIASYLGVSQETLSRIRGKM